LANTATPKGFPRGIAIGSMLLFLTAAAIAQHSSEPAASAAPSAQTKFDKTGPQVGHQVPDLKLRTLKGEEQRLSAAWQGGPALLVTSSLTCPKSRSRWPELKALVERYDGKLNVIIIYVIEAHPVGSLCPYKGVEDVTPENERDGILRKQPATLEDRLELALEFKRLLRISVPIYVDNLKDETWKALGAAPNLALLVDSQGIVVARSGWFEGTTSQAMDTFLESAKDSKQNQSNKNTAQENAEHVGRLLEKAGFESYQWKYVTRERDTTELARMLKAVPAVANIVIESAQGHPNESTLLMDAALERNVAAAKLLIDAGAEVKAHTESYDSALQIAAQLGDIEMARLLLAKGADPAFPVTGKSPLHEAAIHHHPDMVKLLLSSGLRHDLYSAIALGELEMVRLGLQADPSRVFRPDGANRYPLDYAAANGQLEIAQLLLDYGAPIVSDRRVIVPPPLHLAIENDDAKMVELLLNAGSSPNTAVGRRGEYPNWQPALHVAVAKRNLEVVNLLLAHQVDLEARDQFSQTALHDAASAGAADIVAALIEAGANVNAQQLGYELPCGSGRERIPSLTTPLHLAAAHGNAATIKVLLEAGAKIEATTNTGETPLMQAAELRWFRGENADSRKANVETLIAAGANLNACDRHGRSVLDFAASTRDLDDERLRVDQQAMIALLEMHGAKPGTPPNKNSKSSAAIER
jgi:ankyrin repeat protein